MQLFTARKQSLRRLCFYTYLSVILFTGGGGAWSQEGLLPGACPMETPPPKDGYCCGQYTSYWNAFLFKWDFTTVCCVFLLLANKVWGKVIFSQACVKNSVHRGGARSWGCLLRGGSATGGGAWWRTPPDGYCCGRYASYWNAFLFI